MYELSAKHTIRLKGLCLARWLVLEVSHRNASTENLKKQAWEEIVLLINMSNPTVERPFQNITKKVQI